MPPADTREAIMEATFLALAEHGYAGLRTRDIGAKLDASRTLLHYHYDGKRDLVAAFLESLVDRYEADVGVSEESEGSEDPDPWSALDRRIDRSLFGPESADDADHWARMGVYHDLFAQARHDERYRAIFDAHRARLRGSLARTVERGIEVGVFRDVDPERVARLLVDVVHAARERRVSLGHEDAPEDARRAVDEFVLSSLATPEFVVASLRWPPADSE